MSEQKIRDYICTELSPAEQTIALDFINYLEVNDMIFEKDNCDYWKDKIYYWVKWQDQCVCYIAIKNPDEPENHWTVWSDDMGSEWLETASMEDEIKERAWKYADHCGQCGSCSGGRRKVIFGRAFNDICGCTFRVDNPSIADISFLQKMVEVRKREIDALNRGAVVDNKIFSKCGMRCDLCLVYRPNVEREDRREEICNVWKKIWQGFEPDPQTVICDGCCCEKEDAVLFSPACDARKCVMGKSFAHCGYCEQYPCAIFPAEPTHEETIQKIEVEKQWTWEDEKLMEAYACKKYMDEFRSTEKG